MSFSAEGMIATLVSAARFTHLVQPAGAYLQKLPKLTVTWVDPFVYIPSLWIVAAEKKVDEEDVYGELNVESDEPRMRQFMNMAGLPGVPPQDVGCADLGIASFLSLMTQDPATYFEIETEGAGVEIEIAAAFEQGRCTFFSTYNAGDKALYWLEDGTYKKIHCDPYELGEVRSGIHESLKYLDPEFVKIHNIFQGFLPSRPVGELRPLDVVSHRMDTRLPVHPEWGDVFPPLKRTVM